MLSYKKFINFFLLVTTLFLISMSISSCGLRGPLYMPEETPEQITEE